MPPREGWLALLILGSAVSALLAWRARRLPALRPAAVACFAFVAIDAARYMGLPPMLDAVAFVALPACWMGLLVARQLEDADPVTRERRRAAVGHEDAAPPDASAGRRSGEDGGSASAVAFGRPHPRILPRFAPLALCLLYAAAILATRHRPAVVAHWQALLQAPRLAGFALALWVGLRRRDLKPADPSRLVGLVMGGSAGVLAATGAWVAWPRVQAIVALSWLVVGAVALRAR